jgi:hypothetical protein
MGMAKEAMMCAPFLIPGQGRTIASGEIADSWVETAGIKIATLRHASGSILEDA